MAITLESTRIESLATALAEAEEEVRPIEPLTDGDPGISVEDAYEIQLAGIRRRTESGAVVRGHKIGFTSKAMQRQLGVDVPDYGHLLDDMFVAEEEEISADRLIAPRVEPEIAFVLSRELQGPGLTAADVIAATDYVLPALEVIDSRVVDWRIKVQDTIADNASAARVVLGGRPQSLRGLDLAHVPVVFRKTGTIVGTAAGAAVLGNPIVAVVWLLNALASHGVKAEAGSVILSGSFCTSTFATAGDSISASFGDFGSISTHFV
jgi:2-keto-4-pentenoate hydratase